MKNNNSNNIRPLLGTFEVALFMPSGIERFPKSKKAALLSLLIPFGLMMLWIYPLYVKPTPVLGERGYIELLSLHTILMVAHLSIFLSLLWAITSKLDRTDNFWKVVTINSFASIISFTLILPIFMTVLNGFHSWDEVFGAFILISIYELCIAGFAFTRALNLPWQFGWALAFLSMFVWDGVSTSVFKILGI